MAEMYDATIMKVVEKDGKVFIVYGKEPKTLELEAVRVRIAPDEHDPRPTIFAAHNGLKMYIPVGEDTIVPKLIYDVLAVGNLKNRIQKI